VITQKSTCPINFKYLTYRRKALPPVKREYTMDLMSEVATKLETEARIKAEEEELEKRKEETNSRASQLSRGHSVDSNLTPTSTPPPPENEQNLRKLSMSSSLSEPTLKSSSILGPSDATPSTTNPTDELITLSCTDPNEEIRKFYSEVILPANANLQKESENSPKNSPKVSRAVATKTVPENSQKPTVVVPENSHENSAEETTLNNFLLRRNSVATNKKNMGPRSVRK
jgi:hypothetical protein